MSLDRIGRLLRERAGLESNAVGERDLCGAVDRLRRASGLDVERYASLVETDADAYERLVAEMLVHETSFFRYPASFAHLVSRAKESLAARPGPFRVLSVACATGQEPYSVAIALLEAGLSAERVVIDALDRSQGAIEAARAGRFEGGALRGLGAERLARWFRRDGGTATVVPQLRSCVSFEVGSVLDAGRPFARNSYDAVLCRNLLIYLTTSARRAVLANAQASLAPGGVLYVGHAEVLVARAEGFVPVPGQGTYACTVGAPAKAQDEEDPSAVLRHRPLARSPRRDPASASRVAPSPGPAAGERALPTRASVGEGLERARDLADAGRLEEARALLLAQPMSGRLGADHYHLLALVQRAAGRLREADEALARALYLDPAHPGALLLAAVAAEGRGEPKVAERLHARARAAVEGRAR